MFKISLALITLSLTFPAMAQLFSLKVTDYGMNPGDTGYSVFKNLIDTEVAKVQAEINKDMPSAPPQRLMEGMANSSVMAGKGIGSDYASNMNVFLIGGGIGVGADLEKDPTTDSKISGAGVAPGIIVGMNMGFLERKSLLGLDPKRLNAYLNFMKYSHEQAISDKENEKSSAKLDMMALGMHFRYDWIRRRGSKLLGWGGVKLHTGYEYNKTDIAFTSEFKKEVNSSSGNVEIAGDVKGNPTALINATTHSIPLEISTDVQLLYILSLYTGLGMDYNMGKATGKGSLNAEESQIQCRAGTDCDNAGNPNASIQADANIDAEGKVNPFLFRGFAGLQVNLPYVRIFGQVDKAFGSELIGATAGVRFVF
jgi:hypothetical protein